MRKRRTLAALALAALLVVPLSACAAGAGGDDMVAPDIMISDASGGSASSSEVGRDASIMPGQTQVTGQSVIRTGNMSITVKSMGPAADEVRRATEMLGGYIESETLGDGSTSGSSGWASFSLRVPADRFEEAFTKLGEIGAVLSQSSSAVDVTMQHVDLEARIGALDATIARLKELMSGATTTSDLLEIETALSTRQQELDSLRAQLRVLEDQVAQSTIWVQLTTESVLPGGPANFWDGVLAGLDSIAKAAAGGLIVLGMLLPWLVLIGVLALVVVLIVRAAVRRGRAGREAAAGGAAIPTTNGDAAADRAQPAPPLEPRG